MSEPSASVRVSGSSTERVAIMVRASRRPIRHHYCGVSLADVGLTGVRVRVVHRPAADRAVIHSMGVRVLDVCMRRQLRLCERVRFGPADLAKDIKICLCCVAIDDRTTLEVREIERCRAITGSVRGPDRSKQFRIGRS